MKMASATKTSTCRSRRLRRNTINRMVCRHFCSILTDTEHYVDATMKVTVDILRRVYESFQEQDNPDEFQAETIDPDSHLYVIDAFEMPLWHWSVERGTFERYGHSPSHSHCSLCQIQWPDDYIRVSGVARTCCTRPIACYQTMCPSERAFRSIHIAIERSR